MEAMPTDDRRRFPRLDLPVFYRSARLFGPRQPARDLSRGGIRVLTDEPFTIGTRLEIELFLPEGDSLTIDVRVAWVRELSDQEADYEAGLEFLAMDEDRVARLERYITDFKVT
jgi:c-di-GMP-binding flagellar brake protein YcgR